jgi:hypothetical protein
MIKHPLSLCAAFVTFAHDLERGDADFSGGLVRTAGVAFLFAALATTIAILFIAFQNRTSISQHKFTM